MKKMMKSLMAAIGVALTITGSVFAADVATIGEKGYATLQAAIDAVKDGETITLLAECAETITFTQTKDVSFVIDGNNQKMIGSINITARAGKDAASTLVIKNFQFVTDKISHDFIKSVETNYYPNNITIENCSFIGTADIASAGYAVVAVRLKSANNILVKDCTGSGLHSFLQNTAGWNVNLDNVDVTDSLGGFAMGTVQGTTIKNCDLDVETMGIRLDAQYDNNAEITDCKVMAFIPVVVRKASVDGTLTFSGSNTMTAENTDDLWCAIGTSEYEANGTMPTAPTGKVVVTLNDANLPASGVYGNYAVAVVNGVKYVTLKDAVAAVADGDVIMLIANETFTEANRTSSGGSWYEGLYYVGDKSFTINLNGFTITQNGAVNDYLMLFKNEGSKANTITLQNGTMDAGSTAYCAICTSSASTQKIIVNLENVNVIGNNSNGSVLKIRGGTELNVKAGTKITGKNSYLGIECVASTVNIYDGAEIYMKGTGSYNGCLVGVASSGTVNVYDGYGKSVSGGFIAMTSGGTINVFGGEWIANKDGTYANSNKSVLIAQSENGVKSIVNVSGGIFKGGYNCYGNAAGDAQINITGGNFNSDPTTYVVDGYLTVENTAGTYDVAKPVAQIGAQTYTTLVDAFKAATEGCTIEILSDVTIDYKWDCRDYATGGSHSQFKESVTINGNGHTLKFTGTVNDSNWNTIFRFEENATVNNLTVDISEATGAQRVISAKKSLTVDGLTVVGSAKYGIIFGEGASAADLAAAEIVVKNSTLTGTRRAISDNEGGKDVKSVAITDNTLNANVYASASESITFNNNTAAGEVDLRSYTAENVLSVEAKSNTLNAGVKNYIYAKNIDAQEGFTAERVPTTVSTYEQLIAALAEDNAYVVLANDITATATQSSGYGKAGIVVEAGDVLDGNDKTLTINGANATWDCAIAMRGGEVKNLTIAGAMRGVFMPGANGDVVIDNCKFQDVIYTFNSDGGSKDYTVTIKNTELNGWTSFSDVHKAVVFDTCTFAKGNGYAYCRPYQATTFKDCSFSGDFEIDCSRVADNKLAFNGCTYNGQAITSENAFDLFGDGAKVLVNGAPADYTRVAQVGEQIFADLQEAITAAAPNGTVTLLKDVVVDEWKMVTEDYNIASGELITLTMNGLTIDGNGKTLTVNDIESAGNGGYLFQGATSLTVKNLTINVAAGLVGGIALKAGTIENVTFNGGKYAVLPGSGDVIVKDCTFYDITGYAVYFEEDRDNLEITGNTFNCADSAYAVTLRGGADFTNNTVNTGRVNLADSASGTVSGNNFGMERFKVYNGATATITGNTINNLVFNNANVPQNSTFTGNTLSADAQAVLDAMNFVAQVGDNYYTSINAALVAAQDGDTITLLDDVTLTSKLTIAKPVTIDGNGHSIVADSNTQWYTVSGKLNIKNYSPWVVVTAQGCELKNVVIDCNSCAGGVKIENADAVIFDTVSIIKSKADTLTVTGSLLIENYFKAEGSSSTIDAKNGVVTVAEGTIFDMDKFSGNVSPAKCDLKAAVDTKGKPYFCAYGSTTYYRTLTSITGKIIDLTLLDDVSLNKDITVKGTLDLNGKTLTLAEGKVLKTGGNLTFTGGTFAGPVQLTNASHTLTAPEGVEVTTTVAGSRVVYADGKYTVQAINYVAQIGETKYETLAAALAAAQNDAVVELLWAEGNAPIAMNGSVYGKSVTITGTATVDWSKGWLFIGRGGEGDGTVIFNNAKLTSTEASLKNGSYGIHVSASEKGSTTKCNGAVIIQNNSDIQLSYLANRHNVTVDNSRLYVEYGFWVGGRPSGETPDSQPGVANMELVNNSTVTVKNHNGMGVGHESIGNLMIEAGSTFEYLGDDGLMICNAASLVSAGNFFGKINAQENSNIQISGGVYTQNVNEWCVTGYAALPNLNDQYVVGVKPTATVNSFGATTVPAGEYGVWNGSSYTGTSTVDMPLSFVMQFLANQTAADMATSPFADWYGDFVITFTGIENGSFIADGCYLAGYYGDFGWVKIPVDGMNIENGVRYPVMLGVGLGQKYDYICSGVQNFKCALFITPEILEANPNLEVKLELAVVDNSKGSDAAASALVNNEKIMNVVDYTYDVNDFMPVQLPEVEVVDIKSSLTDSDPDLTFALNFKIKDADKLTEAYLEKLFAKYGDYYTDYVLTISGLTDPNGTVKFNANGGADGYLAGQYDAWSKNWVSVPFENVTIQNGQSLYIMEYAAKLMNKQGLRFTLAEVAEIVQNFDCGVYFTPEFLAANPDIKVDLELKVFTEDANGNKVDDISVAINEFDKDDFGVAAVVAEGKQTQYFASLADAIAAADGKTVEILANVDLGASAIMIPAGKDIALDLNGKVISGVCNTISGSLIAVPNTAKFTVKDSSNPSAGKITYAAGTSNVGWTIYNEGNLVLESGTIELTGSWSIGYAVDLRPNAWGVGYANASVFELKGGNIVSSDGGVRIASTSHEGYANVAASFVMNGGKIDAAWDGVFIQQSNSVYDMLSFTMNGGTIESDLNPIRVYGPAPTEYVAGKNSINIALNGGTCTYTSEEARDGWVIPNVLRVGGGNSADIIIDNGGVVVSESFKVTNPVVGYTWVGIANNKYILARVNCKIAIKIIDNEPYIGLGINTTVCPVVALKAATNLENPEWDDVTYEAADDDADEYFWIKPTLNGNAYRFFKLAE